MMGMIVGLQGYRSEVGSGPVLSSSTEQMVRGIHTAQAPTQQIQHNSLKDHSWPGEPWTVVATNMEQ